jgi:hypothetical protein
MMKKTKNIDLLYCILAISLVYGILVGKGIYGFSNDYYAEYFKGNLIYPSIREKLGSLLSTLTIYDKHVGVELTSFMLAFSVGLLIKAFFIFKNQKSIFIFLFIFLLTLHTHPIIMSTSGAMRQGWVMCFVFLSFTFILNKKDILSFLFIIVAIFLHKSGLFFFIIYLTTVASMVIEKKIKQKKLLFFIIGSIFFITCCLGLYFLGWSRVDHRIVSGDFRYAWLFVNIFYIFFFLNTFKFHLSFPRKFISSFLYLHACAAPSFFVMGLNWQYERINMIIGIPIILIMGSFFNKKSSYLYLIILLCMYLFLTIYQGMYSIGLQ